MSEKKNCIECKYYIDDYYHPRCKYPRNTLNNINRFGTYDIYHRVPEQINKNNDCEWYEEKKIKDNEEESDE